MAGSGARRPQSPYARIVKVTLPFTLLAFYVVWMQGRSDRVAKAAAEAQSFSAAAVGQPYLSFQKKRTEGSSSTFSALERHRKLINSDAAVGAAKQDVGSSSPLESVQQPAKPAPTSPAPLNLSTPGKGPKTDFSAVAIAVKDVAARNAALASAQSGGKGASAVAGAASGWDALRDPPESGAPTDETDRRRRAVKGAMRDSWAAYVRSAWGQDELLPVSGFGTQAFCNTGASLLDALDTLWIMDMKQEFARGRDWVAQNMTFTEICQTSLFELVIRGVGGLLSAYDLSKDSIFLTRAVDIADRMMGAFDTPTGIPLGQINLGTNVSSATTWAGSGNSVLSELGSVQMEFVHLSTRSGNASYGVAAERVIEVLHDKFGDQALLPTSINFSTGGPGGGDISMGALADSYYEYLLKVWILKGRNDELYRSMWVQAMDAMLARLVGIADKDQLQYVGNMNGNNLMKRMEHLTCFVAGNLALGVANGAVSGEKAEQYLGAAKNITRTCFEMYNKMPTGLGPETVDFSTGTLQKGAGYNILRPEAVEAICMLYRITNDTIYRDWGWQIFEAFDKYSKVARGGYSGVSDVGVTPPAQDNKMQSFWLAETLKYLYLLFSPPSTIPLDEWVFNTEAHPFALQAKGQLVKSAASDDASSQLMQ